MVAYFCNEDEDDDHMLDRKLYDARVFSQSALDRKIALLSGRFDCVTDPALPGYLAFRALQQNLGEKRNLNYAKHPNFLLQLTREMMFGNPYLVKIVLSDDPDVENAVLNVAHHFENQFSELQCLSRERENAFAHAKVHQLQQDELHVCDPYHEMPELFPSAGPFMNDLRRQAQAARRHPDWNAFLNVAFPEDLPFILELAGDPTAEPFDASFVYISQRDWRMADATGYNSVRDLLREARRGIFDLAAQRSSVDLADWLADGCAKSANRIYRSLALTLFPEEKRAEARCAMKQQGLLGLGLSKPALETLVLLSFCSPNATWEHTEKVLEEAPLSFQEARANWDQAETEYGIQLYEETPMGYRSRV
jgi:hypothetical protein